MRNILLLVLVMLFVSSCAEELIERPNNLIPQDKMVSIIKEMAIVNAAKGSNLTKLRENGIDPTLYIFKKFEIDSAQFVDSDRYYASKPLQYETIYKKVASDIEELKLRLETEKKVRDSLNSNQKTKKDSMVKSKDTTVTKNVQK